MPTHTSLKCRLDRRGFVSTAFWRKALFLHIGIRMLITKLLNKKYHPPKHKYRGWCPSGLPFVDLLWCILIACNSHNHLELTIQSNKLHGSPTQSILMLSVSYQCDLWSRMAFMAWFGRFAMKNFYHQPQPHAPYLPEIANHASSCYLCYSSTLWMFRSFDPVNAATVTSRWEFTNSHMCILS